MPNTMYTTKILNPLSGSSLNTSNLNMSGTTTIYSSLVDMSNRTGVSYEATWVGTASGSFAVQVSNTSASWVDVSDLTIDAAVGAADSRFVNMTDLQCRYTRFKYVNTSGSGSLTVYAHAKGGA